MVLYHTLETKLSQAYIYLLNVRFFLYQISDINIVNSQMQTLYLNMVT